MLANPSPADAVAGVPPRLMAPGFLWGAATSAHQIEGGNEYNDWWDWEQIPGKIRGGARSGSACKSWERYEEDLDLLRALGLNAYRFSVEWSRIEREPGRYDDQALAHYRRVLEACRTRGVVPMVTLHHFTNPRWFAALGGWEERKNLAHFERFARLMGESYGDLVDTWITVNEPEVYGFYAYDSGMWPPGATDRSRALQVIANMLEGHALAAHALRDTDRTDADGDGRATWIGVAKHWALLDPKRRWWPPDILAAALQHGVFNVAVARALAGRPIELSIPGSKPARLTGELMRGSSDFLGLNYYTRWLVTLTGKDPRCARRGAPLSDVGWEIYPEGLERALRELGQFGLPVIVTENGIADSVDRWRPEFIRQSLAAIERSRRAGVDVRGYFHWSLLDNFEWADGFEGRFGLYAVDFEDPERPRVKRGSAEVYREEISRYGRAE
ncbi:MAG TPA: glycoside hydrolase family 1 protein [Candidatus Limnocylindrales bacterium]|nr:glycoside hydrolase family 1 protein [Candidatus Limnocylindrales bacterium]